MSDHACFFCAKPADFWITSSHGPILAFCQRCGEMTSQVVVPLAHPWVDGANVAMWLDEMRQLAIDEGWWTPDTEETPSE